MLTFCYQPLFIGQLESEFCVKKELKIYVETWRCQSRNIKKNT